MEVLGVTFIEFRRVKMVVAWKGRSQVRLWRAFALVGTSLAK